MTHEAETSERLSDDLLRVIAEKRFGVEDQDLIADLAGELLSLRTADGVQGGVKVKRYEPFCDQDDGEFKGMGEVPDGDWVRYSDHVSALSNPPEVTAATPVASVEGDLDKVQKPFADTFKAADVLKERFFPSPQIAEEEGGEKLREENARLRKALADLVEVAANVHRLGAQVGPQWSKMIGPMVAARSALQEASNV